MLSAFFLSLISFQEAQEALYQMAHSGQLSLQRRIQSGLLHQMMQNLSEVLSDLSDGLQRRRVFEEQVHGAHVILLAGNMEGSEAILKDKKAKVTI